ncbi:MAG TPA: Crp/Fnr family transcriptional regulator [Jiangellales bacterium]|nr:Crp/Fnr family transcriptional regulator [Jiangellales bacterium]
MTSLGAIPALRALAPAALADVARASRPVRFGPGAVIRPAAEPAHGVLLLHSGTVTLVHTAPSGQEVWPQQWSGPAIADKSAVLSSDSPSDGLLAATTVTARFLPRTRFVDLLDEHPSVRHHVLARLARDMDATRLRLAQSATLPAVAQVAAWLGARDTMAWRGTQEHLARLLGLSRVTVNRALARLATVGAIRLSDHGIVVVDHARLESVATAGDVAR